MDSNTKPAPLVESNSGESQHASGEAIPEKVHRTGGEQAMGVSTKKCKRIQVLQRFTTYKLR